MEKWQMATKEFTHFRLDEEIKSISGHMAFREEKRLHLNDNDILYYTGYSVTDSTCCGMGACLFVYVTGTVKKWHYKKTSEGNSISEIEPITDEKTRKKIIDLIMSNETCTQVNFLDD
jgi:hypothetical protein